MWSNLIIIELVLQKNKNAPIMLAYIHWNASPEIVDIGPLTLRWYGLLFASGFLIGLFIVKRMFAEEKLPEAWLDKLFIYMVVGSILGARLGHVFFYEWEYYSQHLDEIIKVWQGGLASHGGAVGIFIAMWIYSRRVSKKSILWVFDKLATPVALAGFFIRMGNLMNSEIIGRETDVPWAFIFEKVDDVPRHAVQFYEALFYLASFVILYWVYWKTDKRHKLGYIFGLWLLLIWGGRFVLEFFKEDLGGIQSYFGNVLSTGQLLSIPLIIWGLYLVFRKRES